MTEQANTQAEPESNPAEAAPEPKPEPKPEPVAQAVQQVDVEAIKSEISKGLDLEGALENVLAKKFTPQQREEKTDPILKEFVKNPAAVLGQLADIIEENVEKKHSAQSEQRRKMAPIANEWAKKCPDIQKYPNEINADIAALKQEKIAAGQKNVTDADVLEDAFKRTSERLGLSVKTQEDIDRESATLPPSGNQVGNVSMPSRPQSPEEVVAQMKAFNDRFRNKS